MNIIRTNAMLLVVLLSVAALVCGHDDGGFGRLPDNTEPESYALSVAPADFAGPDEESSFAGQVNITIRVKTTTAVITLNSKDLVLTDVKVTDEETLRDIEVDSWRYVPDQEQVRVLTRQHVLGNRKYTVHIWFTGLLRDDGIGFFKSFYTSNPEKKKWLAVTQFKATHARTTFPCYDEPAFKTTFDISIKRTRNQIALSNMPILNTENIYYKVAEDPVKYQNMTWVYFKQTPPMSTYQVGFFIGEFECLNTDSQSSIFVYTHLGNLYQTKYISEEAPALLKTMEDYTSIQSDLPKLDLLAVPELDVEATENRGLHIYREKSLFVDKNTKTKTKMSVKTMAEHVIAHQWFSSLVTPAWWDHTWLSEGFATYFEYFGTATLEPDWRLEDFFVVEKLQTAMEYEQTPKRPLSATVSTPKEIDDVFDKISYNKGAAVLRMLKHWVGEKVFKSALNIYLTRNQYTAVKPVHLWNAFDNAMFSLKNESLHGQNTHVIMNSWTEQTGYPVVKVTKTYRSLVLTQERFSIGSSNANDTTKWYIDLSYTTNIDKDFETKTAPSVWLDPNVNTTVVSVADDVQWYIFNIQSTGFYRVNYTEDNWLSLIRQLNDSPTDIHVLNRAQLIDDAFNLARAGQLNYTIPLKLTQYLEKEDDIIPWFSVMNNFNYVLDRMRHTEDGYDDVKAFASKIAGIIFQKVSKVVVEKKNNQYPINIGWNVFSSWACRLDNKDCIKMALNYFRRWRNGEEIPADIKDAVYCTGIKYDTQEGNWVKMLDLYKSTKTNSEKESALNALACTEDVQLLITHLKLILVHECSIESQDYELFFNALSSMPSGINALTFFLKNHFNDILKNVKNGDKMVTTIYSILASKVSTKQEVFEMSEIAVAATVPAEFRNTFLPINRDEIEYNQKWFEINSMTIMEFINPGSTVLVTTPAAITENPPKGESSASLALNHCKIIVQILALSVSVKFLKFN